MRFKIYLPLIRWKWAYDGHLWRRSSNEGNTFAKGMWRVVRKRSIDQMITRSFDQGKKAESQNKTMWPKGTGHSNAIRAAVQLCWRWCDIQQSPELLRTKSGRLTEPLQITVTWLSKSVNRWTENFPDENALPLTARVSAEARDENEWDAHDVWEFRR